MGKVKIFAPEEQDIRRSKNQKKKDVIEICNNYSHMRIEQFSVHLVLVKVDTPN